MGTKKLSADDLYRKTIVGSLLQKGDVLFLMEEYAKQKWKEACSLQIKSCSDKVFDLVNTDSDAETWHEKVLSTDIVDYEE